MVSEYKFKYIIVGDSNVGKTSIIETFVNEDYNMEKLSTIGINFNFKLINFKDKYVKIHFWDTGGLERFKSIVRVYFKNSTVVFLTYDVTDEISFNNIKNWYEYVKADCHKETIFVLVGNKNDCKNGTV